MHSCVVLYRSQSRMSLSFHLLYKPKQLCSSASALSIFSFFTSCGCVENTYLFWSCEYVFFSLLEECSVSCMSVLVLFFSFGVVQITARFLSLQYLFL